MKKIITILILICSFQGFGQMNFFQSHNQQPATVCAVGDYYQGGLIGYIFVSGDAGYVAGECHGIIVSLINVGTSQSWWNGSYITTNATGINIGTGQSNTNLIIAAQGNTGDYAAKLCNDYTNSDTGTGVYSDWFLPSNLEIRSLRTLYLLGLGSITGGAFHWTSTESSNTYAVAYRPSDDVILYDLKNYIAYIRAVRYF